jgi:hypothetical protein
MMEEFNFQVSTIYGSKSRLPLVRIAYGKLGREKEIATMPAEDARDLAFNLLQGAAASITDAFLVSFMEARVKAEPHEIVGLLAEFRAWRQKGQP